MALRNPTFADAGALPGEAAHWSLSAVTSLQRLAAFGPAGREDFESWTAHFASLADVVAARGFFGNDGFDDFERAWANSAFLFELPTGRLVTCAFGGASVETWTLPAPLLTDWAVVPSLAGIVEDFVRQGYVDDWAALSAAALATETFSGTWAHAATL